MIAIMKNVIFFFQFKKLIIKLFFLIRVLIIENTFELKNIILIKHLDYKHLLDKKDVLELKIKEYKEELEKLTKVINFETKGKYETCSKIENEIYYYEQMSETCLKNCNQLTNEIVTLKKEIEKFVNNSSSFSSLSTNNYMSSKGSKNTINEKLSGIAFLNNYEKN